MGSVFISHSSVDKELANEMCMLLEKRGINCWIAPRNIAPGKAYGEEIIHGIEGAIVMVLVLSEHSNQSTAVRNEVERAWSKGKTVIPVRISDVSPSKGLEFFVSTAQWIDVLQSPLDAKMDQLSAAIKVLSGENPASVENGGDVLEGDWLSSSNEILEDENPLHIYQQLSKKIGIGYRFLLLLICWLFLLMGFESLPPGPIAYFALPTMFAFAIWLLIYPVNSMLVIVASIILSFVISWYTHNLTIDYVPARGGKISLNSPHEVLHQPLEIGCLEMPWRLAGSDRERQLGRG